ncbi:hypothetical protein EI94DRAFT_1832262 [Lactarius quietus]|nr:hypothetical protein EI94DRAFT_1832262 [Lactarius quietus]
MFPSPHSDHVSEKVGTAGVPSDSQDQILLPQKQYCLPADFNFVDGSDTLFSMYNEKTSTLELELIQNWRKDASDIMILSGLISAAVAGFLSQYYFTSTSSTPDPSSQATVSLLSEIVTLLATQDNQTNSYPPGPPPEASPPLPSPSPPTSQLLWYTGLVLSLVCAVGASLVQEWVRRYLLLTQLRYGPYRGARIRACIMQDGFLEFVPHFLNCINMLLHLSIFLFLLGLIFIIPAFESVFMSVIILLCFIVSVALYLFFTAKSIIRPRSLIVTPLSLILRRNVITLSPTGRSKPLRAAQEVEKHASTHTSSLDAGAMSWLLDSLVNEQELERFLTGIPGFYNSTRVENPAQVLRGANTDTSPKAILAFMNHSLSSDLLLYTTRQDRIKVALKAMQTDSYLLQRTFCHALHATESPIFNCVDFVLLSDRYANDEDQNLRSLARCIIAVAISHLEDYDTDERWAGIIQRRLDWSEALFAEHREHRDSIKLLNLVRIARELYIAPPGSDIRDSHDVFDNVLRAVRQPIHVGAVAPELQKEFCKVWNMLVVKMQARRQDPCLVSNVTLLSSMRTIYITSHQGTECQPSAFSTSTDDLDPVLQKASSYSQCTVPSHHLFPFANPSADIPVAHADTGDVQEEHITNTHTSSQRPPSPDVLPSQPLLLHRDTGTPVEPGDSVDASWQR